MIKEILVYIGVFAIGFFVSYFFFQREKVTVIDPSGTFIERFDSLQTLISREFRAIDSLKMNETIIRNNYKYEKEIIRYIPDTLVRAYTYGKAIELLSD